jgi:hypothetical protein
MYAPLDVSTNEIGEGFQDMRTTLMLAVIVAIAASTVPADAQQKTESECLDIMDKYMAVLMGTLREAKPSGACALARFGKTRHEEILKMYSEEPAECRTTDLGKNLEKTLKVRISQEDREIKKSCRRN